MKASVFASCSAPCGLAGSRLELSSVRDPNGANVQRKVHGGHSTQSQALALGISILPLVTSPSI